MPAHSPPADDGNATVSLTKLRIWQQNTNKSLEAQLDMLNNVSPRDVDIIAVQEPYLDESGFSRGNSHWFIIYPPNHRTLPSRPRSLLLVNRQIDSNVWKSLEIPSGDITGILLKSADNHSIAVYNVYNDQHHARTESLLTKHTRDLRASLPNATHVLWLGDFNRHSPLWDNPEHTQLFTNSNLDAAQSLIDATTRANLAMLLPASLPTLFSSARTKTRPDNVFGSQLLEERLIRCIIFPHLRPIKTDHYPILSEFDLTLPSAQQNDRYNYKLANWEELRKDLRDRLQASGLPEEARSAQEVEEKNQVISEALAAVADKWIPKKIPSPYMR